ILITGYIRRGTPRPYGAALILAIFVASVLSAGCKNQEPQPIFYLSFDGSIGSPSGKIPFDPEFRGYLKRQALRLTPGNVVQYNAPPLGTKGTVQIWIK